MKDKYKKIINIVLSLVFLGIIFAFSAVLVLKPDKTFSEQENRPLQTLPNFNLDSFLSGEFTGKIAGFCSDQFPLRDRFVGAKAATEILLQKRENNNVIHANDGYIIKKPATFEIDMLQYNLNTIDRFARKLEESDIDLTLFVAGRTIDVMQSKLPAGYPTESLAPLWQYLEENTKDSYKYLNLATPLCQKAEAGEYVYYRTDHHWTTLGAYYGYENIMRVLGKTPKPMDFFNMELKSDSFFGTTWSTSGMKWISPDQLHYFRYPNDTSYKTEFLLSGKEEHGFYDLDYLNKKDKYSSFLYGNNPILRITKDNGEKREKLLIIKDSFANSVIPFLAIDFDLVVVDMRYYNNLLSPVVESEEIDSVLILLNADSLTESRAILGMMAAE